MDFLQQMFAYNKPWAKSGPYVTKLSDTDEKAYRIWLSEVSNTVGREQHPDDPTYDMRGLFKKVLSGKTPLDLSQGAHFPDTYKTPYHPTFSNESRYAKEDAPRWNGDVLYDKDGSVALGFLMEQR